MGPIALFPIAHKGTALLSDWSAPLLRPGWELLLQRPWPCRGRKKPEHSQGAVREWAQLPIASLLAPFRGTAFSAGGFKADVSEKPPNGFI